MNIHKEMSAISDKDDISLKMGNMKRKTFLKNITRYC
jgi:hypothetical protein